MKQKTILRRYYQSPDALILTVNQTTFQVFDRIMTQLEKLLPLAFRLVYKPEAIPIDIEEQLTTSTTSIQSTKNSARDWVTNISKRTIKSSPQPNIPSNASNDTAKTSEPVDTLRSTISRKFNSIFNN